MTKLLAQFKATYKDDKTSACIAANIVEAAKVFSADEAEPVIIQKTADNIKASLPDPVLSFTTSSNMDFCYAYPSGGSGIKLGDTLFLTAVVGDMVKGIKFVGWYQGDTLVSEDAEAAIVVTSTAQVPSIIHYEARFDYDVPVPGPVD